MSRRARFFAAALALAAPTVLAAAEALVPGPVADCAPADPVRMPLIAWGADGVTLFANGMSAETRDGALSRAGWRLSLYAEDDFAAQVADYLACRSPFLRGTLGMLMAAAPATEADPRTRQVVFFKHSWSIGDGLVASPGIRHVAGLRGRRIALQRHGPHVDLLARLLADAGVPIGDVELIWTADLTGGGADTPGALLEAGAVDAAAVILADARALVEAGGGAPKARLLASTQEASTVVGDFIAVRADWFGARRSEIAALTTALFEAEAEMRLVMNDPSDPRGARMTALMGDVLLRGAPAEEGALLWTDAVTDGLSGNARHFADPDDPRGFAALSAEVGAALADIGAAGEAPRLMHAGWDYRAMADALPPAEPADEPGAGATFGDIRAEAARLRRAGRLDDAVIVGVDLHYDPETGAVRLNGETEAAREALRVAATYAGAPILIEGHADPVGALRAARAGADATALRALRQEARDASRALAQKFGRSLLDLIAAEGHRIDPGRLVFDGVGVDAPLHPLPRSETEWRANHRLRLLVLASGAFGK